MKTLKSLKDQYGTFTAAAKDLNVHETQLKRLIKKGALYNDKGEVYIPSKTKLKM
jgi:endonuclease III